MRKEILIIITVFTLVFCFNIASFSENAPEVSASSAILIVSNTNEVLFEKNAYERRSMASTTKIMSSIVALESDKLNDEIIITDDMIRVEGTSMGLSVGDKVSVSELVYGMLLSSGNDAANSTAIAVGGSAEGFVGLMNAKASEIGMNNTHFVTPSGLDADDHYSTAYDMAILGSYAIQNEAFRQICSSYNATVEFGDPPFRRKLTNHNKLLKSYDNAIGIKTGFTKKSGRCLVSAAEKNNVTLICVTLNDPDDWNDHTRLLDYGFSQIKKYDAYNGEFNVEVAGLENSFVTVGLAREPELYCFSDNTITQVTELEHFLYAPLFENDIVGITKFYYQNGETADEIPLIIKNDVNCNTIEKQSTGNSFIFRFIKSLKGEHNVRRKNQTSKIFG